MRRIQVLKMSGATLLIAAMLVAQQPTLSHADTASTPSLVLSQLKITSSNGQFITLYNSTNATLDMSKYQLEYFNSYDLSKATSSRLIALSGTLPPHGYYMVNDDAMLLCYQLTVDSASLGLSSTAGLVEVLAFNQSSPGGSVTPVLQDYVGWSKTAFAGAQTLPASADAFLQRLPLDSQHNPAVLSPGIGSWQNAQPGATNPCDIVTVSTVPASLQLGLTQLLPATEAPATLVNVIGEPAAQLPSGTLPVADIGLMAPEITELLPNPNGSGTDASQEFIELYNPNNVVFDLSGFSLQAGVASISDYTFPAGTNLPPKEFLAFYPVVTRLSLSNSGGQVRLFDPAGINISSSEVYSAAKDGQAWARANGKWYWTTQPTPRAANIINQPIAAKKSTAVKTKSTTSSSGKVKGASTTKKSKSSGGANSNTFSSDTASSTPIHPWTLAIIGSLALVYGAYEYRADLANRFYQLRSYLRARRVDR